MSVNAQDGITSLVLNKIPGSWHIDESLPTQIITSEKLSYVYVRNGKYVWIFKPNSRRFQDVKSLDYIGQIEIQNKEEPINEISIPRDGLIYITTNNAVYDTSFEEKDGKLYLK